MGPQRNVFQMELEVTYGVQEEFSAFIMFESTRKGKSNVKQCILEYSTVDSISLMNLTHLSYSTTLKESYSNAWKMQYSNEVPHSSNRFCEAFLITYIACVALFSQESLKC